MLTRVKSWMRKGQLAWWQLTWQLVLLACSVVCWQSPQTRPCACYWMPPHSGSSRWQCDPPSPYSLQWDTSPWGVLFNQWVHMAPRSLHSIPVSHLAPNWLTMLCGHSPGEPRVRLLNIFCCIISKQALHIRYQFNLLVIKYFHRIAHKFNVTKIWFASPNKTGDYVTKNHICTILCHPEVFSNSGVPSNHGDNGLWLTQ